MWQISILENSKDAVVNTVQPTVKTGRKWKVVEAVDQAKECLKFEEVIGLIQNGCKGLGSATATRWSKEERKEKRFKVISKIRLNEDSWRVQKAVQQLQQGQWTNWDNALQKSFTWNDIWSDQLSNQISCPPMHIWYAGERKKAPLISYAKVDRLQSLSWALAKSPSHRGDTHRGMLESLGTPQSWAWLKERLPSQNQCIDIHNRGKRSVDPEWDSHPNIIEETKAWYRDPFSFHTTTGHCGANRSIRKLKARGPHLLKREILEPDQRARRCRLQSCGDARWGWRQRIHRVISLWPSE